MLQGKAAIVTGGARGIGAGIARVMGSQGARVAVLDLDGAEAEKTALGFRIPGLALACDVAVEPDTNKAVTTAAERLGGLDILVNNAGVYPRVPFLDMKEGDWDYVLDVNLKGSFFCAQAAARRMIDGKRRGAIVNFASPAALRGVPGLGAYSAAFLTGLFKVRSLDAKS